jgi:branched-chain amino acid aminotransferase
MAGAVFVNGKITTEAEAVVPVFDHGFLYGEGVYEVCRTYHGQPFLLDRHLTRLRASAGLIALPVPYDDRSFGAHISATMETAGLLPWTLGGHDAYIRLLLTRGVGELTYDPAACRTPTLVIIARPHQPPPPGVYAEGVNVAIVPIQRNAPEALNPLIKSNNLLNNALAMQRALAEGGFEAVMRNHLGELAECSQSNLFIVRRGQVLTPPLRAGLLAGITRQLVLEMCEDERIPSEERTLHDAELFEADEAFLTSSTREIVPIVRVDGKKIGIGEPGAVTTRLRQAFRARVEASSSLGANRGESGQIRSDRV